MAILALIAGLLVGLGEMNNEGANRSPNLVSGTLLQPAKTLTEFELINQNGEPFSLNNLQGAWTLMFFGFINCPDICPTTLRLLKNVKSDLQGKGAWLNKRVVFVTVDPARDTVEKIKPYVDYFDKDFIALTGTTQQVQAFAKQLSLPFVLEPKDEFGGYNVAHSASILLVNPEAKLAAILSAPHEHSKIVYDLLSDYFSGKVQKSSSAL